MDMMGLTKNGISFTIILYRTILYRNFLQRDD